MVWGLLLILSLGLGLMAGGGEAKAAFSKKKATKNIKASYKVMDNGILATYKNKNTYAVSLTATVKFVDAAGQTIGEETFLDKCFPKKKSVVYFFRTPMNDNGSPKRYGSYSLKFSVKKAEGKDSTGKIKINYSISPTVTNCTAMNLGKIDLSSINATFVFYNSKGDIMCIRNSYLNCRRANTANDFTLTYVGLGTPKKMKIYVNWAY